jgi:antitoxin (DNA-binding transcriptional repressor) of toxin-antitoxin stability system
MKFFTDREFRNEPGKIREALASQEVVMTNRGKPYAVLLPVNDSTDIEEVLLLASRIKAQVALSTVRRKAAQSGLDEISMAEIDGEIQEVRTKRSRSDEK